MPQRISSSKLAAEFLVIFVSVILALLADDWRTKQLLIAEERLSLEAMLRDLAEDETDLERLAGRLQEYEEGAITTLNTWAHDEVPATDEWLRQFDQASGHYLYRSVYPTYAGLKQSGRLNLIRDPDLRDWIIEFHGDLNGYLSELHQNFDDHHEALTEATTPYFAATFDTERSQWRSQLITPLETLQADTSVRARLSNYTRSVAWLHMRIDELFIPHNQRLRVAIQAYLDGRPLPARIPRE